MRMMRTILAAIAMLALAQPALAQTTPAVSGDAVSGAPAVVAATSTASGRTVKQEVVVQLCLSGGNYVVCPAVVAGPQTGANSTSVTPASDAVFPVTAKGGSTIATGAVSVGTSATLIAAARTGRQRIAVTVTGAVQCSFGPAGVTLANGWALAAVAYTNTSWDTSAALYGICASAATDVRFREEY